MTMTRALSLPAAETFGAQLVPGGRDADATANVFSAAWPGQSELSVGPRATDFAREAL